jgi:metallo-beta-lactamase family protein
MKITVVGAAGGEVTGSAYYVQTNQASILVDCGLFQGGKKSESLNRPPTGPRQTLADLIQQRYQLKCTLPGQRDVIEL